LSASGKVNFFFFIFFYLSIPTQPCPHRARGTKLPKAISAQPPCALCDFHGHQTKKFLALPKLHHLLHASLIPIPSTRGIKDKECLTNLRTTHACIIYGTYGHYTHDCPNLPHYRDALQVVLQLQAPTSPQVASTPPTPTTNPLPSVDILYIFTSSGDQPSYPPSPRPNNISFQFPLDSWDPHHRRS